MRTESFDAPLARATEPSPRRPQKEASATVTPSSALGTVSRLGHSFAAEVRGFDATAVDERTGPEVLAALYEHQVLVFPGQRLTPEQHVAFTRALGPIHVYTPEAAHPDHPEILIIRSSGGTAAEYWHTDGLFYAEPPSVSLLYGVQPPPETGDTLFADAHAAYETLPESIKDQIDGAQMVHPDDFIHPMVRSHPVTGRKALYVDLMIYKRQIVGMPSREKEQLLKALRAHLESPELLYRHRWTPGDLVLWDNAAVLHKGTGTDPQYTRLMHRTTVRGTRPV